MIRLLSLFTALCMIASQSLALSCLRLDPVETFQRLAAAPEQYFVLYGTLTFDEAALPEMDLSNQTPAPEPIPGHFEGKGLTREGFTSDYVSTVNVQVQCAGPWCGGAASGVEAVFFVPFSEPPVSLIAEPCGGMIFPEPSEATLGMLTSCMQGGTCERLPR